jgi:viroplasmin and RNaseH domain-containing protein
MSKRYYVVFKGRKRGIYFDIWDNVKKLTDGFSDNDARFYKTEALAREAYGVFRGLNAKIRKVNFSYLT